MPKSKVSDNVRPAGRIVIVVIASIIALAILVFLLWRPIRPNLDQEPGFGAPAQETIPPAPPSGG
jgi:hypothetical protein